MSANGSVLTDPNYLPPPTGYEAELATVKAQAAIQVANILPAVLPNQIAVSITGHVITGVQFFQGVTYKQWIANIQAAGASNNYSAANAYQQGLALDVIPTADQVLIQNVLDSTQQGAWGPLGACAAYPFDAMGKVVTNPNFQPLPTCTDPPSTWKPAPAGILIVYTIDGYTCGGSITGSASKQGSATLTQGLSCNDAGFSYAVSDVNVLDGIGNTSNVFSAVASQFPGQRVSLMDVSPGDFLNNQAVGLPSISAVVVLGINVQYDASSYPNTSVPAPTDVLEAQLDGMLTGGMLNAIFNQMNMTVTAPSSSQTARLTRAQDNQATCPIVSCPTSGMTAAAACQSTIKAYKAIAIAFVAAFGLLLLLLALVLCVRSGSNKAGGSARMPGTALGEDDASIEEELRRYREFLLASRATKSS